MTTDHRVIAFCDWLDTLPAGTKFHEHPGFTFFRDLTDDQIDGAQAEMRRRAATAIQEAGALTSYRDRHRSFREGNADARLSAALGHLKINTSGGFRNTGFATVSIFAIDVVLMKLEELLHGGPALADALAEGGEG